MSFVVLGGDDNSKPTYFELLAADQLVPSLKSAVVYTLSVLSQRYPWIHRALKHEDELLALLMLLVDWHSLITCDATFAEGLYGLRRKPAAKVAAEGRISLAQMRLGLVLQVGLPYLQAKTEKLYRLHVGTGLLGLALSSSASRPEPGQGRVAALHGACLRAFVAAFPYLHAAIQGTQFVYHLSYLLGLASVHRPALHALGMEMARVSAQDMDRMARDKSAARQRQLAWLTCRPGASPAARAMSAVGRLGLGLLHLVSDHHQNGLMLSVFGFKALEWWYNSAEERLAVSSVLPPPPPPPPPKPSRSGVGLPSDPSLCPVCKLKCTNPAQVATSGYVFCYPCAFGYVMERGCCPVSGLPAGLDHIRKLYEGTG